jgi:hypothetical protein
VSRLYATTRATGTQLLGPPLGDWSAGDSTRSNRGANHWTFLLSDTKTDGGVSTTQEFGASETKVDDQPIIGYRWVTPLLEAVTLSGTLDVCFKVFGDSGVPATAFYQIYAYITVGDSLTLRTVLIDNYVDNVAFPTVSETWRSLASPQAVSGAVQAGDRIVVEIGAVCTPATAPVGDNVFDLRYGTTNSSLVTLADATPGSTSTGAAWIEFSDTLTPQAAPAPPANDACADAVAAGSLPYTSPRIDTTTSLGTDRAVYYTFTAGAAGRYFVTTLGSNYSTTIKIYDACGGSLATGATNRSRIAWINTSQTTAYVDADAGASYWIEVTSYYVTSGGNAARNSGGSLVVHISEYATPEIDDLFVDCQHIVCYRDGTPINIQSGLYGFTPTGSAIDYTLRPMDSFNGGVNTALRLYVCLFGSSPLVEIFDLATLNVGEFEIDYIDAPLGTAARNLAAAVFDASGTIYFGFYGNNYSVAGGTPSSAASSAIRFLDATHADGQSGAPWPAADSWEVDLESEGTNFVDLAVDQETLFYTSAGTQILRVNVATGAQLGVYATVAPAAGPRPGLRGLRILPPGDGSNGVIVAAGSVCYWIGADGSTLQTYTPFPASSGLDLDKVEITNDGETFWVSDQWSAYLFQFDISSGSQLQSINTGLPPGQLCGFTLLYGYRAGDGEVEPPEPPEPPSPYLGFETRLPIRRLRVTPTVTNENKLLFVPMIEIDAQVGVGNATGAEEDTSPVLMVRQSTDGGYTWGNERTIGLGEIGKYNELLRLWRWNAGRRLTFEVSSSAAVPAVLTDLWITVESGDS